MKTDIEIAQEAVMDPITSVAKSLGLGEDDIELLSAGGGVSESILTDHRHLVVVLQLVDSLLYELGAQQVFVNGNHRQRASRGEFVGNVAGACEKDFF